MISRVVKTADVTSNFSLQAKKDRLRKLLCDDHRWPDFKCDEESLWCITNFQITRDICLHLRTLGIRRKHVVLDAFAGVGGSAIQFGAFFKKVYAVELDPLRKKMMDANLKLFGLGHVITYTDYFQNVGRTRYSDVIFFDPPWGLDYRKHPHGTHRISIREPTSQTISLEELIADMSIHALYCVVKLPVNYDMQYFKEKLHTGKIVHEMRYSRPNSMQIVFIRYN